MTLYQQWEEKAEKIKGEQEKQQYWLAYFEEEKNAYAKLLQEKQDKLEGTLKEVAESVGMDALTFIGFMDGINTSLEEEVDVKALEEETVLNSKIVFEKLYVNMIDNKADWLYNLPEWDGIYSEEERSKMKKDYNRSRMAVRDKSGRNDPCPCGSGKKYKKCCGSNSA